LAVVTADNILIKIQVMLEVLVEVAPILQDFRVTLEALGEVVQQVKEIMVELVAVVVREQPGVVVVPAAQDSLILTVTLVAQAELDFQVLFLVVLCFMQVAAVVVVVLVQDQVAPAEMVVVVLAAETFRPDNQDNQVLPIVAEEEVVVEIQQAAAPADLVL
jgi:hypothetical protein